jgi:hypothetical protein
MRKKLGEILVESGVVTLKDLESALGEQRSGEPSRLGDLLVSLGKLSPLQLALALSAQYGVPFAELPPAPSAVIGVVPLDFQRQFRFVPIKIDGQALSIAMADLSQATTDVLPRLRKQFARVNLFVGSGDEIDAVHAALSGEHEPAAPVRLPQIAPVIAPVSRLSPPPTAEELFGSLDLDVPAQAQPAEAIEVDVSIDTEQAPEPSPAPRQEEEPYFFEAVAPTVMTHARGEAALDGPPDVEVAEPVEPAELIQAAEALAPLAPESSAALPFDESSPEQAWEAAAPEPVPIDAEAGDDREGETISFLDTTEELAEDQVGDEPPSEEPRAALGAEDDAFFAKAPPSERIGGLVDDDFVPGVPASSPSSLAPLVIEPEAAVIASVPPAPVPSSAAEGELPEWLKGAPDTGDALGWTGALDHLAPSKLIFAVTRALIRRGVLSEEDILDAADKK